ERLLASSLLANLWPATTWSMARARELEKFFANSPYLPSLEALTRSRHRRLAVARISSSVFSMMFTRGSWCPEDSGFAGLMTLDISAFSSPGRGSCEDPRPETSLLVFANQVITGRLLHGVFTGFGVTAGNCQYMPVLVVHLHRVTPVVVTRPACFLAEQRVLSDALCRAMPVLQLPGTQQFVNVLRSQVLKVFLHDRELLEADIQEFLVGHVAN